MQAEERYKSDVVREYEGEGIIVHWEPSLCIHTANCIRALPSVFDPNARPWVKVEAAGANDIAAAIWTCPTGALRYERTDGSPQEPEQSPVSVEPRPNGPLFVRGSIEIIDSAGKVTRAATRMALCRCGHSSNKRFCDLSHQAVGFEAD